MENMQQRRLVNMQNQDNNLEGRHRDTSRLSDTGEPLSSMESPNSSEKLVGLPKPAELETKEVSLLEKRKLGKVATKQLDMDNLEVQVNSNLLEEVDNLDLMVDPSQDP